MKRLVLVSAACASLVMLAACVIEDERPGYGRDVYRYNQRVVIDRDDDRDRWHDWNDRHYHGDWDRHDRD